MYQVDPYGESKEVSGEDTCHGGKAFKMLNNGNYIKTNCVCKKFTEYAH